MAYFAAAVMMVGCVGTGAYLAMNGHPWLGFFAMLIGASIRVTAR
jgi:hypothetical protein